MHEAFMIVLGGLLAGIPAILAPWLSAKQQAAQQRRDLAVQISLELWKRGCCHVDAVNKDIKTMPDVIPGVRVPASDDPGFVQILEAVNANLAKIK